MFIVKYTIGQGFELNEIIKVTKIWLHEIFNILDKDAQDDKEWDEFIEKLYNQKRQREGLELYIEKNGVEA